MSAAADFSPAAASLFANVRLPASILAGALVPLGFGFALPADGPALSPGTRRAIIRLHRLVAVTSYSCLLLAIVYASVSINGLAESPHGPSGSAIELIRNEYTLAWIATNVTFLLGLFGALALVTLRVLLTFERDEGRVAAGFCLSTALLMASIVDEQVKRGGFADDILGLLGVYFQLTASQALASRSPLLCLAIAIAIGSSVAALPLLALPSPSDAAAAAAAASQEVQAPFVSPGRRAGGSDGAAGGTAAGGTTDGGTAAGVGPRPNGRNLAASQIAQLDLPQMDAVSEGGSLPVAMPSDATGGSTAGEVAFALGDSALPATDGSGAEQADAGGGDAPV